MTDKINPWGPTASVPEQPAWELVPVLNGPALYRVRIPGGWLYRLEKSKELAFVPG